MELFYTYDIRPCNQTIPSQFAHQIRTAGHFPGNIPSSNNCSLTTRSFPSKMARFYILLILCAFIILTLAACKLLIPISWQDKTDSSQHHPHSANAPASRTAPSSRSPRIHPHLTTHPEQQAQLAMPARSLFVSNSTYLSARMPRIRMSSLPVSRGIVGKIRLLS